MPLDISVLTAVLFDVDGTLIDSNAVHADTWAQALTEYGIVCDASRIRPLVGMGGDKLLPIVAGVEEDSPKGRTLGKRKKAFFAERLPQLLPTPGARALVSYLRQLNKDVVVATSADAQEMRTLLQQAGVADLIPEATTKDDAEESKPDPDIVKAAIRRAGAKPAQTLMIGDTPYDIEAARRAGIDSVALRCGGHWSDAQLEGAIAIFDHPGALLDHWRRGTV